MRLALTVPATAILLAALATSAPVAAAGGPLTTTLEAVNAELCPDTTNATDACRSIHGRPGRAGALDVCAPSPPMGNLIGAVLWFAVKTADTTAKSATGDAPRPVSGGVCRSAYADALYVAGEADAYFGLCEPSPPHLIRELVRQTACPHLP